MVLTIRAVYSHILRLRFRQLLKFNMTRWLVATPTTNVADGQDVARSTSYVGIYLPFPSSWPLHLPLSSVGPCFTPWKQNVVVEPKSHICCQSWLANATWTICTSMT